MSNVRPPRYGGDAMAGARGVEPKSARMTRRARAERTERILLGRLEELARALERSGASNEAVARLLESASVATMNAVALNLISSEAADHVWREAEERHPQVAPLRRAA
jgi:hypothetical protein